MNSVNVWRITPFFDFSPNPSIFVALRRDPYGSFTVPAQNGQLQYVKEAFSDSFVDRSITGRIRSRVQGSRLKGTILWNEIVDSTAKDDLLDRLYVKADAGFERFFQRTDLDGGVTGSTTITIKQSGTEPVPSDTGGFYTGMIVGIGTTLEPNPFVGTFVRATAYNAATKVVTLAEAVTASNNAAVVFWIPVGIQCGFFLNTLNEEDGEVRCFITGESPVYLDIDNRIPRQPVEIEFMSRDLVTTLSETYLK